MNSVTLPLDQDSVLEDRGRVEAGWWRRGATRKIRRRVHPCPNWPRKVRGQQRSSTEFGGPANQRSDILFRKNEGERSLRPAQCRVEEAPIKLGIAKHRLAAMDDDDMVVGLTLCLMNRANAASKSWCSLTMSPTNSIQQVAPLLPFFGSET